MKNKLLTLFAFLLVSSFGVKGQTVIYEGNIDDWGVKATINSNVVVSHGGYEITLSGKLSYDKNGGLKFETARKDTPPSDRYIKIANVNLSANSKVSIFTVSDKSDFELRLFKGTNLIGSFLTIQAGDKISSVDLMGVADDYYDLYVVRSETTGNLFYGIKIETYQSGSSTDNTLHSLKVNGAAIEDIRDEMNVTIPFSYDEPTIPVEFTVHDAATVTINENTVTSPATIPAPEKTSGANSSSTIVVTSEEGTPKEYTLNVTRATVSSIPELGEVTVGDEIIVFADGEQSYMYPAFPYGTTTFPEVLAKATGGSTIESVTQATMENQFATILVKAEDGVATKEYTINFSVADPIAAQIVGESVVKTWDFNWSQETLEAMRNDNTNWFAASSGTRYSNSIKMTELIYSDGSKVAETNGLVFSEMAASTGSKDGSIRVDYPQGGSSLTLDGSNVTITLSSLTAGQLVRVIASPNTSTESEKRYVTATNTKMIGGPAEFIPVGTIGTYLFEVIEDGNVVLTQSKGLKWYSIQILDGTPLTAEALSSLSDIRLNGDITESDLALLNAADLASIDLTRASFIANGLKPLNPNCLVYASKRLDGVKNLVVNGEAEAIELTDITSKAFNCPIEFTAAAATYTRSFTAAGIYTLCLPFDATVPENVTIEEFSGNSGYTVIFTPVTEIVANTPYLITVAAETTVDFKASEGAKIKKTEMVSAKGSSTEYEFCNNFVPMINGEAEAGSYYLLRADGSGFGKAGSDSKVGSFRGYIKPVGVDPAKAPALVIGDDGGATGLETVNTDKLIAYSVDGILNVITSKAQSVKVYAVDGRLVRTLQFGEGRNEVSGLAKGIYIVDNRKVAVK